MIHHSPSPHPFLALAAIACAFIALSGCGKKPEPSAATNAQSAKSPVRPARASGMSDPFTSPRSSSASRKSEALKEQQRQEMVRRRNAPRTKFPGSVTRASKYSNAPVPAPGQRQPEGKPLPAASEGDAAKATALVARSAADASTSHLQAIIDEARGFQSDALVAIAGQLQAASDDPSIRGQGLALLEGYNSDKVLPVVSQALNDPDADVRREAVAVASTVTTPEAAKVLISALKDPDMNVRQASFQALLNQDAAARQEAIVGATTSAYTDLALAGFNNLRILTDKTTVPMVISGLGHQDPLVQDLAHEILYLTFQADLKSPAAATAWWTAHQDLFDGSLTLKDPSTVSRLAMP